MDRIELIKAKDILEKEKEKLLLKTSYMDAAIKNIQTLIDMPTKPIIYNKSKPEKDE